MKVAIGQDSHRIDYENSDKKLLLGGVAFQEDFSLVANSDGDVVLHALTNAVSGITGHNILGKVADEMYRNGIVDSEMYLREAVRFLEEKIVHVSISIEAKVPKMSPKIDEMRKNIARILEIEEKNVGITATTGEGLTQVRRRKGN